MLDFNLSQMILFLLGLKLNRIGKLEMQFLRC